VCSLTPCLTRATCQATTFDKLPFRQPSFPLTYSATYSGCVGQGVAAISLGCDIMLLSVIRTQSSVAQHLGVTWTPSCLNMLASPPPYLCRRTPCWGTTLSGLLSWNAVRCAWAPPCCNVHAFRTLHTLTDAYTGLPACLRHTRHAAGAPPRAWRAPTACLQRTSWAWHNISAGATTATPTHHLC